MPRALMDEVRDLLALANEAYITSEEHTDKIKAIVARLDEPLRVAIAGKVKAGKSTLLNALVGEELAPTDAGECTKIVTWYRNGHTYRVDAHFPDGDQRQVPFKREEGALQIDLGGKEPDEVDHLEVTWPSAQLAELTLIDTPGLGSLSTDVGARSAAFLSLDDDTDPTEADAVIYLMRHLHRSDLDFLEAFHDDDFGQARPINAVAVLSRADEVGACRVDAITVAHRVAGRLRAEPRMRKLCQTVVPVAGLLAQAAMTLTETQFRQLKVIADLPRDQADAMTLTADRFLSTGHDVLDAEARENLLDRLGLFGVRTSISLIRLGSAQTAGALADKLRERSGIAGLRSLLLNLFASRRDLLKARAALTAIDAMARTDPPPDADRLILEIERITAGAHELVEVDLMNLVRSGELRFKPDEAAELDLLLGNLGAEPAERLGVDEEQVTSTAVEAIDRWRRKSENPLASREMSTTARAITRSYEGILSRQQP